MERLPFAAEKYWTVELNLYRDSLWFLSNGAIGKVVKTRSLAIRWAGGIDSEF